MKAKKMSLIIIGIVIVIAIVGWSVLGLFVTPETHDENNDSFAKCLSEKGATMYGAEWCGHCKNQKEMFGESFKDVNYVECPDKPDVCLNAGIRGYPTWVINGVLHPGVQSFETLSSLTGCPLE